jgi:hypothetical protein
MSDTPSGGEQQSEGKEEDVERLNNLLSGAYIYEGDGEWCLINDVDIDDDDLILETESVHYTAVPNDTRQQAYDSYSSKAIIVHPDGINVEECNV